MAIGNGELNVRGNSDTGSTTITASALGETISVPVTVSHGDTETRNAKAATCTEDGYTGDEVCTVCGATVTAGETIPATGHSYQAVTTAPTCTAEGYTTYTCTVCGDSYTADETDATGHSYGEPTFVWSEEYNTICNATFVCSAGDSTQTVTCVVTSAIDAATCTKDGQTVYTATATFNGKTYTDQRTVTTAAKGHGTTVIRNAKDATCTEDGYTGDEVCTVCGETVTTGSTIPATGHTTGDPVIENEVAASHTTDGSYDSVDYGTVCCEERRR